MINNLSQAENGPIDISENRPFEQLVHRYGKWQHISSREIENLAITKYQSCRLGITFNDITTTFQCKQTKAQKKLKLLCNESSNKNGERVKPKLFTINRTKPQQYFPSCIRATIIENKRKRENGLIDPTGVSYNNKTSHYPLHNAIENQIVQSFLLQLYLLPWQPLNMHNLHLWMVIDKSHYNELFLKPWPFNESKVQVERIGLRKVVYKFHKTGSIEIDIACSRNPFQLETDNDVNNFFVFLGKVQYTLAYILSDPRERIVPPIDNWILKSCDFNKDMEIEDKDIGQLMNLNIQIKHAGKAFRLYVKNLEDRFVLRGERTMKVNLPITTFMNDSILSPFHLIDNRIKEFVNVFEKRLDEILSEVKNGKIKEID